MEYEEVRKAIIKEGMSLLQAYQLDSLWDILKIVKDQNIPGSLVETGVYKGGAAIVMQHANITFNLNREIYLYDSFKGLPNPKKTKIKNPPIEKHSGGQYSSPKEALIKNLNRFDYLNDNIHIVEGWFEDTLPDAKMTEIAILRFDGDMYSSTWDVLNNLYNKVVDKGFIIIDDYCLNACKVATDEFRAKHNITDTIFTPYGKASKKEEHLCASYWRKGIKI